MTYKEGFQSCKTEEEFRKMLEHDLWIAKFLGNKDREKAIMRTAQEVADERGWIIE